MAAFQGSQVALTEIGLQLHAQFEQNKALSV